MDALMRKCHIVLYSELHRGHVNTVTLSDTLAVANPGGKTCTIHILFSFRHLCMPSLGNVLFEVLPRTYKNTHSGTPLIEVLGKALESRFRGHKKTSRSLREQEVKEEDNL